MFIRQNLRIKKDGTRSSSYSLREHHIVGGESKQVTLLNLGPDFAVPKADWPVLIARIKDAFRGQAQLTLEEDSDEIRKAARAIVRRLRAADYQADRITDLYAGMRVEDMVFPVHAVRSAGGERTALRALEDLQFENALQALGMSRRNARISVALVVARMLKPAEVADHTTWLHDHSSLLELLGIEEALISVPQLVRLTEQLYVHRQHLLTRLFECGSGSLNTPNHPVFCSFKREIPHDPSNPPDGNLNPSDGRARSMACYYDGLGKVLRCELVPWPHRHHRSLRNALRRIKLKDATLVFHADEVTGDMLWRLSRKQIKWITINQLIQRPAWEDESQIARAVEFSNHTSEMRLYAVDCNTEMNTEPGSTVRPNAFETALESLHEGLSKPHRLKSYGVILDRVERLKRRYPSLDWQYDVHVTKGRSGKASSVTYAWIPRCSQSEPASSRCVLRTNHVDWNLETILQAYRKISDSERTYASIAAKGHVGTASRSASPKAQVFLTILVWQIATYVLANLRKHKIDLTWDELRLHLQRWKRITTLFYTKGRQVIANRQDGQLSDTQQAIAAAMHISPGDFRSRVIKKWS